MQSFTFKLASNKDTRCLIGLAGLKRQLMRDSFKLESTIAHSSCDGGLSQLFRKRIKLHWLTSHTSPTVFTTPPQVCGEGSSAELTELWSALRSLTALHSVNVNAWQESLLDEPPGVSQLGS